VLVGGEGTRLRPLTLRTLKQLVPILNRPLLEHLLLHLRRHGIREVTLAMTHHSQRVQEVFGDGSHFEMDLRYVHEQTPLGSGGAIAGAAANWDEPFLVCNGDLLTDLDITAFVAAHQARAAELSIALYEVEDPSPFGVVVLDSAQRITQFVEKPPREIAPSRMINAGVWLFEPSLVEALDATRFNRVEDALFPTLASRSRPMYGFVHDGFWLDIGNPDVYLQANLAMLDGLHRSSPRAQDADTHTGAELREPVLIGARSRIAHGAIVERTVCGEACTIDRSAQVHASVLWHDVAVGEGARVSDSVLADHVRIGAGAVVRGAVLGQYASVAPGEEVPPGTRVVPDARWAAAVQA
jgi:mannose-1-phosphate guanylyltransferase